MKTISYIAILLVFLGPCIYAVLGWQVEGGGNNVPTYQRIYPAYFILWFYIILAYVSKKHIRQSIKKEIIVTFIIIGASASLWLLRDKSAVMIFFNSIGLPILYSALFTLLKDNNNNYRLSIRNFVILLFIFEILLAYYEKITLSQIFPLELAYDYDDNTGIQNFGLFRSTALLGSPLSNALIVSIIMSFIIISDLKPINKYTLFFLGFISLLCFNARASIFIWALFFPIHICYNLFYGKTTTKNKLFTIVICTLLVIGVVYFIEAGWSARLFEKALDEDSSALARIEVWSVFNSYNISIFLLGLEGSASDFVVKILGHSHVENWFILMALNIGVVYSFIFIWVMFSIFKRNISQYSFFEKAFILSVFLLLASTNNSLACGVPAIAIFFVCSYSFKEIKNKTNENINSI